MTRRTTHIPDLTAPAANIVDDKDPELPFLHKAIQPRHPYVVLMIAGERAIRCGANLAATVTWQCAPCLTTVYLVDSFEGRPMSHFLILLTPAATLKSP